VRGMWGALPSVLVAHIEQSIESALAEQAAGEAERTAQAVAREREACAALAFDLAGDGGSLATWRAIRARATSPAPEAAWTIAQPTAEEREIASAVAPVQTTVQTTVGDVGVCRCGHGPRWHVDRTGNCASPCLCPRWQRQKPAPEPVAAERAVVEAAIDWRAFVQAPEWRERALFAAVDALAAARKDGAT